MAQVQRKAGHTMHINLGIDWDQRWQEERMAD